MKQPIDYNLFVRFFESYKSQGFKNIDPTTPMIVDLEEKMTVNKQFFYIADLIQLRVLFVSNGYYDFFGQIPLESYTSAVFEASHPDNKQRHSVARTKLIRLAQDMFNNQWERMFLNSNLRIKNMHGDYIHLMFQGCLILSDVPYHSVFLLMVLTDITEISKIKHGYHFYSGTDESFFRFPDYQLLMTGNVFTKREYEIINCISDGLDSHQIAEKLFLSIHTVITHRKNILNKTGKRTTHELVIELRERGVI
jgi:DNA-binding CsgD family transcriptional regulator